MAAKEEVSVSRTKAAAGGAYKAAGVDQEGKDRVIDQVLRMARRTHGPRVIDVPWGFAGFFSLTHDAPLFKRSYRKPVLMGCADGVGTKLRIAFLTGRHDTVGIDLVAMNVNDLLVHGGEPLFFLDYIATGKVKPQTLLDIMKGIVEGCRQAGCALLGGETAEMPGFYGPGEYDLSGFLTGVVEKDRMILGKRIAPGDRVVGLLSNGLHSNGYSLVRKVLFERAKLRPNAHIDELGGPLADELLRPTRIYAKPVLDLMRQERMRRAIKGMAHITGGGLVENLPRVLPAGTAADLEARAWDPPPIFHLLRRLGKVSREEMYRVFNMGIGYVMVVDPYFQDPLIARLRSLGFPALPIGEIRAGRGEVNIVH